MIILEKKTKEYNPNEPEIPDHPYRILTVGGSRSRETNAILNLINHEPDTTSYKMIIIVISSNLNSK